MVRGLCKSKCNRPASEGSPRRGSSHGDPSQARDDVMQQISLS